MRIIGGVRYYFTRKDEGFPNDGEWLLRQKDAFLFWAKTHRNAVLFTMIGLSALIVVVATASFMTKPKPIPAADPPKAAKKAPAKKAAPRPAPKALPKALPQPKAPAPVPAPIFSFPFPDLFGSGR